MIEKYIGKLQLKIEINDAGVMPRQKASHQSELLLSGLKTITVNSWKAKPS